MRGSFRLERFVPTADGPRAEGVFVGELFDSDGALIGVGSRRQSAPASIHGARGTAATIGPVDVDVMGFVVRIDAVDVATDATGPAQAATKDARLEERS